MMAYGYPNLRSKYRALQSMPAMNWQAGKVFRTGLGQYATDIGTGITLSPDLSSEAAANAAAMAGSPYSSQLLMNQLNQLPVMSPGQAAASAAMYNPPGGLTPTFDLGSWLQANWPIVAAAAVALLLLARGRR